MVGVIFFFNHTAATEIYTLSYTTLFRSDERLVALRHAVGRGQDADVDRVDADGERDVALVLQAVVRRDRKSTRLNSSHANISHAVFCLNKNNFLSLLLSWVVY